MRLATIAAILAFSTGAALACMPQTNPTTNLPKVVISANTKGIWEGHWCKDPVTGKLYPYIAAATLKSWALVGNQRAVAAWYKNPTEEAMTFGDDPYANPTLRAVWTPEYSKLLAIKPVSN